MVVEFEVDPALSVNLKLELLGSPPITFLQTQQGLRFFNKCFN
jgi:hypothetical protein